MTTDVNINIQEQIKGNIYWMRRGLNWVRNGTSWSNSTKIDIFVFTHRQRAPSGRTFIQAIVASDLSPESSYCYPPIKIDAVSGWHLSTENALANLLVKTEEMIGNLLKEKEFPYLMSREKLHSLLELDELNNEIQLPPDPEMILKKEEDQGSCSALETRNDSKPLQEGTKVPSHEVTMAAAGASTSADLGYCPGAQHYSDHELGDTPRYQVPGTPPIPPSAKPAAPNPFKDSTEPLPDASLESLPIHAAATCDGEEHVLTLRIPAKKPLSKEEILELSREAAREVFENDGMKIARLAAQKQVNDIFANLGSLATSGT